MPAERHESTVPRPGAPELYADFPAHLTADGDRWYRVHRREHSPWWYSCSPGRFNLRAPRGTLNTASDPSCAAREMLGPRLVGGHRVPGAHVAGLVITALSLRRCAPPTCSPAARPATASSPGTCPPRARTPTP
ncbi:hypothetical protein NBM05_00725 [Rothia sp. AR01]|uniref:RES domain-containing protein n=1 Tax=Rothia santali TaxID=2949643 RepID=A0A9X2H8D8_9MICC|nr:RES domain-containing protein [Rothia santali]MCP3424596.1 hypothetical protein [Rothia santali]